MPIHVSDGKYRSGLNAQICCGILERGRNMPPRFRGPAAAGKLNILFIFTDQERYFRTWPSGFSLPGRERVQRAGVTFHNHYCPATMCTSSRSVLLTGLQTADNRMFENCDVPWIKDLSTDIPTIGHMLRKAGYYTAYKGKWHLSRAFDENAERLLTKEMEAYGFADYNSIGDLVGHQLGGYRFDHLIAGSAITWLRNKGRPLSDESKPWALTVSLVNPHDVMYFNTDAPGETVQNQGRQMKRAVRAPNHASYKKEWDIEIPRNLNQSFDDPGRPSAHREFLKMWDYVLGHVLFTYNGLVTVDSDPLAGLMTCTRTTTSSSSTCRSILMK